MRRALPILLLPALFASPTAVQPPAENRLTGIVEPFLAQHQVPGLSVAVVRKGEVLLAAGFGHVGPGSGVPVTGDTRFRLASITKPLTAVLVLRLAGQGKLALDEPARLRCPAFTPRGGDPTIRDLLGHQGGLRHPTDKEDTTITGAVPRLSAAVSRLAGERLRFSPGTDVLYSSWGYAVLGCAVEEATGRSYFEALKAFVLDPAGMTGAVADRPDFAAPDFSPGFRLSRGRLVPSVVVDTRFKQPASGLIASAADLARFAAALYRSDLLPEAGLAPLFTRQITATGRPTDFSLGLMLGRDRGAHQTFYHSGSMEGATAFLYLIPGERLAVAVLANRERFVPDVARLVPQIVDTVAMVRD